LYFPAGTYLLSSALTVPDGTTLVGSGMTTARLQGQVVFGSTSSFTDLKIGPESAGLAGLANSDGASGSSFTRCHFRGGGGEDDVDHQTVTIGKGNDVSDLTFTDCEFERSLGADKNTMIISAQGNTVDTVTFDGCHFGVTNGVAAGAGRMMVEVWTAQGSANKWQNITFDGCTFEVSTYHQLDFACYGPGYTATPSGRGENVLVKDCLFKGAGTGATAWGYGICSESAYNITVTGNTFYRCRDGAIWFINFGWPADNEATITDNVFDYDEDGTGAAAARAVMTLYVSNATVTGNTLTSSAVLDGWPDTFIELNGAENYGIAGGAGNTVTGNTFYHHADQSYLIREVNGATANTLTPNTTVEL
jgi:hypothetical protein